MAARLNARLPTPDPSWWMGVVFYFGVIVGPAVIEAWLLLTLSGRRRPTKGWPDRLGRAIVLAWIVLFLIYCCARLASLRD